MAQEFKANVWYDKNWIEELRKETVLTRIYADRVMIEMSRLRTCIKDGEPYNIRVSIAPLRYEAPEVKKHRGTVASIIKGIDWLCKKNDPNYVEGVEKQIAIIYHSMIDTEYEFNQEKLQKLPEWQSQLP